jgi:ABC transporter
MLRPNTPMNSFPSTTNEHNAELLTKLGYKTFAIIHDTTDYGKGHKQYFSDAFIQGVGPLAEGTLAFREGRKVFPKLTVEENLRLGAYAEPSEAVIKSRLDATFGLFPRLGERRLQIAGTMPGGEQAMISIGRGLMRAPKLLLIDEPSLGLSPRLVEGNSPSSAISMHAELPSSWSSRMCGRRSPSPITVMSCQRAGLLRKVWPESLPLAMRCGKHILGEGAQTASTIPKSQLEPPREGIKLGPRHRQLFRYGLPLFGCADDGVDGPPLPVLPPDIEQARAPLHGDGDFRRDRSWRPAAPFGLRSFGAPRRAAARRL